MAWMKNYKSYWFALLTLSLINSFYGQKINRFQEGSYTFEIVVGMFTLMFIFLIVGLCFFGIGKVFFRQIGFSVYLKVCLVVAIILTGLFLFSYFNPPKRVPSVSENSVA
jgi:drug/metabolite transporter (DMT)-like permease